MWGTLTSSITSSWLTYSSMTSIYLLMVNSWYFSQVLLTCGWLVFGSLPRCVWHLASDPPWMPHCADTSWYERDLLYTPAKSKVKVKCKGQVKVTKELFDNASFHSSSSWWEMLTTAYCHRLKMMRRWLNANHLCEFYARPKSNLPD